METDQPVECTWCPNRCILGTLTVVGMPKDTNRIIVKFTPVETIGGMIVSEWCKLNFVRICHKGS